MRTLTIASELYAKGIILYPPSRTATTLLCIFRNPYVIHAYPTGDTLIYPMSPFAASNPADIIIKSGLNSLIIGNNKDSQA